MPELRRSQFGAVPTDQVVEVDWLLLLGVTRIDWWYPKGADVAVLTDPDKKRFCIIERKDSDPRVWGCAL